MMDLKHTMSHDLNWDPFPNVQNKGQKDMLLHNRPLHSGGCIRGGMHVQAHVNFDHSIHDNKGKHLLQLFVLVTPACKMEAKQGYY